jgi:hypothetical protein
MRRIEFDVRNIMNAISALRDDLEYLLNPNLARVAYLSRASCKETAVLDGENYGFKEGSILIVEWAIDKDIMLVV